MKRILLLFSLMLVALAASAANATGHFFHGNLTDKNIHLEEFDQYLRENFDIDENTVLLLINHKTDELNTEHQCYQQVVGNVIIEDGRVLAHYNKDGILYAVNGSIIESSLLPSTASLLLRSQNDFGGELVIASKQTPDGVVYIPAYKVFDFARMADVYIDAETGEEFKVIPRVYNMTVEDYTMYDGKQTFEVSLSSDDRYVLLDETRNIKTLSATGVNSSNLDYIYSNLDSISVAEDKAMVQAAVDEYASRCSEIAYDDPAGSNCVISKLFVDTFPNWYKNLAETGDTIFRMILADSQQKIVLDVPLYVTINQIESESSLDLTLNQGFVGAGYRLWINHESTGLPLLGSDGLQLEMNGNYMFGVLDESGTVETSGTYYTPDLGSAANQAHWGMKETYDFYSEVFNLKSYDGKGSVIYQFVNPVASGFFNDPTLPNNAVAYQWVHKLATIPYWEATLLNFMVYGMGDGITMRSVVALDVMAHEFTHLVTSNNGHGGLNYIGESGALNESFSDIMGFSVENYVLGDKNYQIGEDVMVKVPNLRNMKEPKLSGAKACPDTYEGLYWIKPDSTFDHGGVHYNSGVQNKWFYLINEGGSGTNDNGDAYQVEGMGIEKGRQIAYRNLMTYLIPNATFADAREGSIQAAIDLFGAKSDEHIAVENAWYAVGVGDDYDPTAIEENELPSADDKSSAEIFASEGIIYVSSPEATDITIYATDGSILYSADNVSETEYAAPGKGVYIVRAGESVVKVSVK